MRGSRKSSQAGPGGAANQMFLPLTHLLARNDQQSTFEIWRSRSPSTAAMNNYCRTRSPRRQKRPQFSLAFDYAGRNMTANRAVAAILIASPCGMFEGAPARRRKFLPGQPGGKRDRHPDGRVSDRWSRRGVASGGDAGRRGPDGRYAIVQAGASGFRSIYASALTPLAVPGVVYGRSRTAERSNPCQAGLFGDHDAVRVLQ